MLLSTQHKMDVWEDVWVTNIVVGLSGDFFYVMIWRAGIGKKNRLGLEAPVVIWWGYYL